MYTHVESFDRKGVSLVVIGNGQPGDLDAFRQATGFTGTLLTDPERNSYRLLKFKDTLLSVVGVKSFAAGFKALTGGHKPGALKGSALQLGGAVIITPENTVLYYYQSTFAGDDPPVEEMLRTVSEL